MQFSGILSDPDTILAFANLLPNLFPVVQILFTDTFLKPISNQVNLNFQSAFVAKVPVRDRSEGTILSDLGVERSGACI